MSSARLDPVTDDSFTLRRAVTGVRDLLFFERFLIAIALAWLVRSVWFFTDLFTPDATLRMPVGWPTATSALVGAALVIAIPSYFKIEGPTVTPIRLVVAPPKGDFGPMPVPLRLAALLMVVTTVLLVVALFEALPAHAQALDDDSAALARRLPQLVIAYYAFRHMRGKFGRR